MIMVKSTTLLLVALLLQAAALSPAATTAIVVPTSSMLSHLNMAASLSSPRMKPTRAAVIAPPAGPRAHADEVPPGGIAEQG